MIVIQTVDVQILYVPAEGGEEHAQVHPGGGHPADPLRLVLDDPEKGLLGLIDVVEIVQVLVVLHLAPCHVGVLGLREPRPVLGDREISSILDLHPELIVYLSPTLRSLLVTKAQNSSSFLSSAVAPWGLVWCLYLDW